MVASGEAPVRSKAGALLSPATLVISSFIMHSVQRTSHGLRRFVSYQFCTILFHITLSKLSRLREAPTVRSAQCDCPRRLEKAVLPLGRPNSRADDGHLPPQIPLPG